MASLMVRFVEDYLARTFPPESFDQSSTALPATRKVLIVGRRGDRLRLFQFILGQKLALRCRRDVHGIRSYVKPELVGSRADLAASLVIGRSQASVLDFYRHVYLYDRQQLIEHLQKVSYKNRSASLPIAFLIDDFGRYVEKEESPDDSNKRQRVDSYPSDSTLASLIQLSSLLIETAEHCSYKLRRSTFLFVCLDLTYLETFIPPEADNALRSKFCDDIVNQLSRRYFTDKVEVDLIDL